MVREHWYIILRTSEVRRRPLGIERLGRRLVAWRDNGGRVRITEDRCPHRSAALSAGWVEDGEITCPFHGFRFTGEGTCTRIPSNGDRPVPRAYDVRSYATREAHGYVWMWWGDADARDEASLPPLPWHPELDAPGWRCATFTSEWPVHWSRCVENQLDMAHLAFVHHNTIGSGVSEAVTVRADVDETRIRGSSDRDDGAYFELRLPNTWLLHISPMLHVQMAFVPISGDRTKQYLRTYQRFVPLPGVGELVAEVSSLFNRVVLAQDRRVVLSQRPIESALISDEKLVQADAPIAAFRRWRHRGTHPKASPAEAAPANSA